mmetsp:Transcript_33260/g.106065  ORF Transcript_33260/g.106065 Transcript_33260/m.106065 type:complete len:303 (+) Transcript_33260:135-1043(+)
MGKGGDAGKVARAGGLPEDFIWSPTDEPHLSRRKQILEKHPEIKKLYGPDLSMAPKVIAVVVFQLTMAWYASTFTNIWALLAFAHVVSGFGNQSLLLAIHELSHFLVFHKPTHNRLLGFVANVPVMVPVATSFRKYHMEHHMEQGVDGVDMDIPHPSEALMVRILGGVVGKTVWVAFNIAFYAIRPTVLAPKSVGFWDIANWAFVLATDALIYAAFGWKGCVYLLWGSVLGGGLHPMAGHFIAEHYTFNPKQETYSYYGPLNMLTWNVGYHNEHHDFPRVPGSRLPQVTKIAPELCVSPPKP